jgi:hypothetical protein
MRRRSFAVVATLAAIGAIVAARGAALTSRAVGVTRQTPVAHWSLEAQRAIVPPPAGVGDKFPGEAAVYMGIVHAAMYDAAVAIQGGYRPYAISLTAPADTAPAAAIAAAAHGVLVSLFPAQQADLDDRYANYLSGFRRAWRQQTESLLGNKLQPRSLCCVRTMVATRTPSTSSGHRAVQASLNLIP